MLKEMRGAITALALVACLVMLAASFDVGVPGQALLQSLRFHIAAVVVVLSVLLLGTGAWWRGVLFLAAAGWSAGQGILIVQMQQDVRAQIASLPNKSLLKLLSFNVLNTNTNGTGVADYILNSGADVVMLMEASPLEGERDRLIASYPYRAACETWCELMILSKTPLTEVRVASLGPVWRNRLTTAVTVIDGNAINLVLAHMVKPYFDNMAASETYVLAQALQRLEGPILLAGDFNSAAWSENIARLARWRDLAPGPSYPATWPVGLGGLGVPIDNVFTKAPLVITSVEATEDSLGSNHRGLVAQVALATATPEPAQQQP